VREDAGVVVHEVGEPGLAVPPDLAYLEIPLWSFVAATRFAALDATVAFDVVETPDYRGEALHLAPRPETALVVWLHSTMMVVWNCEPGYVRSAADDAWHALEMAALERADLLLAPSQLLLDTTAGFLGERMRPAELMPYLFDAAQFPLRPPRGDDGPLRVLFYGRLEARKNPELALQAVAAARARGLEVELTFLGRSHANYRELILMPLASQLGLHPRYLEHADTETVRAELAQADLAILASRFDNSPLTIFEALSSGVPVITSDRVGTASWFGPDEGLLALPIDDPLEFALRASEAMADSDWMESGLVAAARMRERFAPELVTARLLDCYARLMAARGRPPARVVDGRRGQAGELAASALARP
jgi:glycosyltransferase involved in cell wall biosynthesis